jgi:LacI family transcriptional regulator
MAQRKWKYIGVWSDFVGSLGRGVLQGVARYTLEKKNWRFYTSSLFMFTQAPSWHGVELDGLIVQVNDPRWIEQLRRAPYPAVNISEVHDVKELPTVTFDNLAIGRLAAEYLLQRGLRHFAFVGPAVVYACKRHQGYSATLARHGFACARYEIHHGNIRRAHREYKSMVEWVRQLPKPAAVLAANDIHALDFIDACSDAGVSVPEQVAVLGVDNDELVCRITHPRLSSIQTPAERVGYESARLLDALMAGKAAGTPRILVQPTHVITRPSTDTVAIEDHEVAQAVEFIRGHAGDPISVNDVLAAVPVSRRWLERRFRQVLGRSPLQEIRRMHLEQAKRLLVETDLQMTQVAHRSGFGDATYLGIVFRRHLKISPSEFRRRHRNRIHKTEQIEP